MQIFRALGAPPPDPRASGGWRLCPQTPSLRRLGASPPDPHWPLAAGGSAPRPPKQPPHCEFLATRLNLILQLQPSLCQPFRSLTLSCGLPGQNKFLRQINFLMNEKDSRSS